MKSSNEERRRVSAVSELAAARSWLGSGTLESVQQALAALDRAAAAMGGGGEDKATLSLAKRELEGIQRLIWHGSDYWTEVAARAGCTTGDPVSRSWEG